MPRWLLGATLVAFSILSHSATVLAEKDPLKPPENAEAAKKLKDGNRLYALQDYEAAIEAYKAGFLIDPSPLFHYNLAQAHRLKENYEEALYHYKRFLDQARPKGELRVYVEDFIKVMTAKRNRAREEAAKNRMSDPPKSVAGPLTPPKTVASPEPAPWYVDGIAWGLVGGGVVAAGVGVGFGLNASSLRNEADNESDQTRSKSLRETADSRLVIGGVVGGLGAAIVLAGIIKLALVPAEPEVRPIATATSETVVFGLSGNF